MKANIWKNAVCALAAAGMVVSAPVEARTYHHHHKSAKRDPGHGKCLRFNKTTGAIAGAAGGAVLGKVLIGGPVAVIAAGAAGGIIGHKAARNGRKHCRR